MEIIILLTLLLIGMMLGGWCLQAGKICVFGSEEVAIHTTFKRNRAVKLATKGLRLLNIVTSHNILKGAQTTLIYTDIHTFWG